MMFFNELIITSTTVIETALHFNFIIIIKVSYLLVVEH